MRCFPVVILLLLFLPSPTVAQPKDTDRPIRALLVTGGCCHDYDRQKLILTRGVSARANVRWTVVHQGGTTTNTPIPLYNDPNWADGFDIVVHNECFSDVKDLEFVDRILKPHRDGLPAILIHCAMHCYRVEDDRWFRFVGMQSPGHGPHYSYTADNVKPDHPIMQDFGPMFVAPKGELYHSMKVFETATPLAQANRQADGMPQVCVWTNDYQGTRVFGCTIGHYNETMAEPKYLDMMARAVLWATGRDPETGFTPSTEKTDEEIRALITAPVAKAETSVLPQTCCGDGNLALGKPVTSKTEQSGNFRKHLTDGRTDTRWCANGGQTEEWVTVDLGDALHVRNLRLHWERREGTAYRYTVEASADGQQWSTIVDQSQNRDVDGIRAHKVDSPDTRYVRTTFLGSSTGGWGSLWELEVYPGDLPALPERAKTEVKPAASISDVQAPEGFDVTMFAAPPQVNYPVCLTATATGEVFVGVDEQGSLGKEPGRGKVLRCIDSDGDGTADQISEFAKMDHPRGLICDDGSLWVLHPPFLSVFRDTDGDGSADESEVLIEGISTQEVEERGADHTTNGIRMGIDGWIYIAVGDFGFNRAVAKDGTTLSRRGGGVVRIRPDGSEMEIYSWGQRNIVDVAIDPYMNIFTRDNTNDGGGWDIRLSHILQTANYGYPSLYKNFTTEIMPPLADYGGGSGCGAMCFHDERWPAPYSDILMTCDWGRSEVFSHKLPPHGATFDAQQDTFLKLPRPTDIDADGSGRMYVSSWKNGQFAYGGPDVGFVAMVMPVNFVPHPVPRVKSLQDVHLVDLLKHPSDVMRLHVQREILRRPASDALTKSLLQLARSRDTPLFAAVAAIWTLKQANGAAIHSELVDLSADPAVREFCLRALADRTSQLEPFRPDVFVAHLDDPNERIRAAAVIGLGRAVGHAVRNKWIVTDKNGRRSATETVTPLAEAVLPLTKIHSGVAISGQVRIDGQPASDLTLQFTGDGSVRQATTGVGGKFGISDTPLGELTVTVGSDKSGAAGGAETDGWRSPWPERVIPHLAVKALVDMNAVDACVAAVGGPCRSGALWALSLMHSKSTVDGLFKVLSLSRNEALRRDVWTTLIRLYHREGEFTEDSPKWWGTRPDTTGPYYDRQKWSETQRIGDAIRVALSEADDSVATHIKAQLKRHVVNLDGISDADLASSREPETVIQLPQADPNNPSQIANLPYEQAFARALAAEGKAEAGQALFRSQSCISCHTFANGQQPRGPHLVDIGKRYKKEELIESILDPSKKIAQGFDTWTFAMASGKVFTGFVALESAETVTIRQTDGLSRELLQEEIEDRVKQEISMMPKGLVGNLTPEQVADLISWLQTLR